VVTGVGGQRRGARPAAVGGLVVELTARQTGVLAALVESRGRVLSRPELLRAAWREDLATSTRSR